MQYVDVIDLKRKEVKEFYRLSALVTVVIPLSLVILAYMLWPSIGWVLLSIPFVVMLFGFQMFLNHLKGASATTINEYYDQKHWHRSKRCQYHETEFHNSKMDCYPSNPTDGCDYSECDEACECQTNHDVE